jgi:uncharacterized protein (TIGR02453 family)
MTKAKQAAANAYFTRGTFKFLRDLEANNNRDWFLANKERYESIVKEPFLHFIADFGQHLEKISSNFVADPRPNGGSMMRIYRDIRFSKDKSPYKTWLAAHFSHQGSSEGLQAPGFYLSLSPDQCFAGGGLWHPDSVALKKIRDSIAGRSKAWQAVLKSGIELSGETSSRPPKGFQPDHPFIEDIKRKDFCVSVLFKTAKVCEPGFLKEYAAACKSMSPLMKFLTEAVGLEW